MVGFDMVLDGHDTSINSAKMPYYNLCYVLVVIVVDMAIIHP